MADRSLSRLVTALLVAAAPSLVVGGLWVTSSVGDGSRVAADTGPARTVVERRPAVRMPSVAPAARGASRLSRGLRPDTVVVPALDVRADVTPIVAEDGALDPPTDPRSVGWWSEGARPGDATGAAVLTGHTVHTGGGAFDELEELSVGDLVLVLSGRRTVAYDVASVRVLSRAELARQSARIFGGRGAGRLVLVTCEDWDGTTYRSNVVVTARVVAA